MDGMVIREDFVICKGSYKIPGGILIKGNNVSFIGRGKHTMIDVYRPPQPDNCSYLEDAMIIEEDILVCGNTTYDLPNGVIISADDVHFACQPGAVIKGSNIGILITPLNAYNIHISNCTIQDANRGILIVESLTKGSITQNTFDTVDIPLFVGGIYSGFVEGSLAENQFIQNAIPSPTSVVANFRNSSVHNNSFHGIFLGLSSGCFNSSYISNTFIGRLEGGAGIAGPLKNCSVTNNRFINTSFIAEEIDGTKIMQNSFLGGHSTPVAFEGSRGRNSIISGNEFVGYESSVRLSDPSNITLERNKVRGCLGTAFEALLSSEIGIVENKIENCGKGISISFEGKGSENRNSIVNNTLFNLHQKGLVLHAYNPFLQQNRTEHIIVSNNSFTTISGDAVTIVFTDASHQYKKLFFSNNRILNNRRGLVIEQMKQHESAFVNNTLCFNSEFDIFCQNAKGIHWKNNVCGYVQNNNCVPFARCDQVCSLVKS
ncbi:hypothetical protein CMO92_00660 [Candidatus Woesearchaeota archaeon]|nr:hypothetical protein [Candidatus Woesearchaeota archaeon]